MLKSLSKRLSTPSQRSILSVPASVMATCLNFSSTM